MKIKLLIVFLIISPILFSQSISKLQIRNYPAEEYNGFTMNFCVAQDENGLIYVGNSRGLLEYDGNTWRVIELPNNSIVRSIEIDKNGTIYIGGINELGYLELDEFGQKHYVSLSPKLKELNIEPGLIRSIYCLNNDVYFDGATALLWLHDNEFTIINSKVTNGFVANNQLFVMNNKGIQKLKDDSLYSIPFGDFFAKYETNFSIPTSNSKILIGTVKSGLFTYDFSINKTAEQDDVIKKLPTEKDELFRNWEPWCAVELKDGTLAIGTFGGGGVIINWAGKLIKILNIKSGINNQTIMDLFEDTEGNIWLASHEGISKVDIRSKFSFWDKINGLKIRIRRITNYKNQIYITSNDELFMIKNDSIEKVKGANLFSSALMSYRLPYDTTIHKLLINSKDNRLYEIEDGIVKPYKANFFGAANIYQPGKRPNWLYIAKGSGTSLLVFKNNTWKEFKNVGNINIGYASITEENNGDIWLSTNRKGIYRIRYSDSIPENIISDNFNTEYGLKAQNLSVRHINKRIVFCSHKGLLNYDSSKDEFIPDNRFGEMFCDSSRVVYSIEEDSSGKVWISGRYLDKNNKTFTGVAVPEGNGVYKWIDTPFKVLPDMQVYKIFPETSGVFWILGNKGLFRYNGKLTNIYPSYKVLLRKVLIGKDSIINYGKSNYRNATEIDFKYNSISFQYASPTFYNEEETKYQTYLEGYDENWSLWSKDIKTDFTNLSEGNYKFHVKAKNIYGVISEEGIYEFIIAPPWHRTWWARSGYGIIALLILIAIVRWRTANLKQRQKELVNEVRNATKEIREKKEEIEYTMDQLATSNKNLEDKSSELEKFNKKLEDKSQELEKFNSAMLDREMRILELKEEANKLSKASNLELPYPEIEED